METAGILNSSVRNHLTRQLRVPIAFERADALDQVRFSGYGARAMVQRLLAIPNPVEIYCTARPPSRRSSVGYTCWQGPVATARRLFRWGKGKGWLQQYRAVDQKGRQSGTLAPLSILFREANCPTHAPQTSKLSIPTQKQPNKSLCRSGWKKNLPGFRSPEMRFQSVTSTPKLGMYGA